MKAKVRLARHALHPMLVVFPLGLFATSVVWDICRLATGNPAWGVIGYWTILAGVAGGLLAAIPGFVDWLAIPNGTRAKSIGVYHMMLNLAVIGLFGISLIARTLTPGGYGLAGAGRMFWGWIAAVLALVSGWLGGELVETLGIGVAEGANANAPSSLGEGHHHRPSAGGRRIPTHHKA